MPTVIALFRNNGNLSARMVTELMVRRFAGQI